MACPVFEAADLIGKKWTLAILQEVEITGERGFNQMSRRLKKVTPKILSQRLKELEEQGIITKISFSSTPPATSYALTKKGKDLQGVLNSLKDWHNRHCTTEEECSKEECVMCPMY